MKSDTETVLTVALVGGLAVVTMGALLSALNGYEPHKSPARECPNDGVILYTIGYNTKWPNDRPFPHPGDNLIWVIDAVHSDRCGDITIKIHHEALNVARVPSFGRGETKGL
jgi:hypothetical protein